MFNEPFDLRTVIMEATNLYKHEAQRKGLDFEVDLAGDLRMVVGDSSKVRTVVANITANARKKPSFLIFFTVRGLHLRQ
jgi:signal transduction histidine kinase